MQSVLDAIPPIGLAALYVALYNVYLKRRETHVDGWHSNVSRSGIVTNGRATSDVWFQAIGPAVVYEVEVRVHGDGVEVSRSYDGAIPKMSCDSEPIEMTLTYPEVTKPWVTVTWTEASRLSVMEQGIRLNAETKEYQRWQWHTIRNLFRLHRAPKGHWEVPKPRSTRSSFAIPTD